MTPISTEKQQGRNETNNTNGNLLVSLQQMNMAVLFGSNAFNNCSLALGNSLYTYIKSHPFHSKRHVNKNKAT